MAVTVKELLARTYLLTTPTSVVNPAGAGSASGIRIDKCTVSNPQTSNYILTAYIIPSGGSGDNTNKVINGVVIPPGTTYGCPEIVNQVLGPGTSLSLIADTSSKLNVGVSGTVFSG